MTDEKIRMLVESGELRSCLYLVKNGVPFDVAFSLEQHEVTAYCIVFGILDGDEWDWSAMAWKPQK
jgi:hypothetical protein